MLQLEKRMGRACKGGWNAWVLPCQSPATPTGQGQNKGHKQLHAAVLDTARPLLAKETLFS